MTFFFVLAPDHVHTGEHASASFYTTNGNLDMMSSILPQARTLMLVVYRLTRDQVEIKLNHSAFEQVSENQQEPHLSNDGIVSLRNVKPGGDDIHAFQLIYNLVLSNAEVLEMEFHLTQKWWSEIGTGKDDTGAWK